MRDERGGGAVSVPVAVSLLALIMAVGLAVDGVRAAQGLATADSVAEEAARAAGQALDASSLARGVVSVDGARAAAAARQYLIDAGVEGRVAVVSPYVVRVDVEITRPTILLGLVGREQIVSRGSAEAQLVPVQPEGST